MEAWDAYDRNKKKIKGLTIYRKDAKNLPEGVYHLVSDVIVRHKDNTILIMQRDPNKEIHPGIWEATAGGSALKGEDEYSCAFRELEEETGIVNVKLTKLNEFIRDFNHTIHVEFLGTTDVDKDSIILQEGETVAYKWVTLEELKEMKDQLPFSQEIISELK